MTTAQETIVKWLEVSLKVLPVIIQIIGVLLAAMADQNELRISKAAPGAFSAADKSYHISWPRTSGIAILGIGSAWAVASLVRSRLKAKAAIVIPSGLAGEDPSLADARAGRAKKENYRKELHAAIDAKIDTEVALFDKILGEGAAK